MRNEKPRLHLAMYLLALAMVAGISRHSLGETSDETGFTLDNLYSIAEISFFDCNGNGTNDSDELAAGTSVDLNCNALLDECDSLVGDVDEDGDVDADDRVIIVSAQGLKDGQAGYPGLADLAGNREIDQTDLDTFDLIDGGFPTYCFGGPDQDLDGVNDACDNCLERANTDQRDSNLDGFGSLCDPDVDNNGVVNLIDFRTRAATSSPRSWRRCRYVTQPPSLSPAQPNRTPASRRP